MSNAVLDKQVVRQGWIQSVVVVITLLTALVGVYVNLKQDAQAAMNTADKAEKKAEHVEGEVNKIREEGIDMGKELVRIRTILDERLPPKGK